MTKKKGILIKKNDLESETENKRFTCKYCKYHSDVKGEVFPGIDGYPAKIIHPSKFGHCLFYKWNLLNWDICEYFELR